MKYRAYKKSYKNYNHAAFQEDDHKARVYTRIRLRHLRSKWNARHHIKLSAHIQL